jgi:hypothetical protein
MLISIRVKLAMTSDLFAIADISQTAIPAGQLSAAILACQKDLQTGLVDVDLAVGKRHHLLFAGGELVNVYRSADVIERVDPERWSASLNGSSPAASLRALALTPQAVRIVKILIEQTGDTRHAAPPGQELEAQLETWLKHPVPALAHVRWPGAEALALFPGAGTGPYDTLFVAADQRLHSSGTLTAFHRWEEPYISAVLLSSEPRTLAWTEFLLHYSFTGLVTRLLERFEELTGRILLNNITREINFTSAAHGWGVQIRQASVTDQTIFPTPQAAAEVYSRLLEVIFGQIESILGVDLLNLLVRETLLRFSKPCRVVLEEYLLISAQAE